MSRLTVGTIMGLVGVLAFGLAALVRPTESAMRGLYALTFLTLFVATVAAAVRPAPAAGWRGFAIVGWGYLLLFSCLKNEAFLAEGSILSMRSISEDLIQRLHPEIVPPAAPGFVDLSHGTTSDLTPTKTVGLARVPLDPEESRLYEEWMSAYERFNLQFERRRDLLRRLWVIAHLEWLLLFASLGAIVGRLLAPRPGRPDE